MGKSNCAYHPIFQSTSSARRTTKISVTPVVLQRFQSTSSARRTTPQGAGVQPVRRISIHVLREEDDNKRLIEAIVDSEFQSTPSVGRATANAIVANE